MSVEVGSGVNFGAALKDQDIGSCACKLGGQSAASRA